MEVRRQVRIEAPVARVWDCLTDPAKLPRWISAFVDEVPDDPAKAGVGATSTLRLREGRKVVAYRSVVTMWEEPRRLAIRLTGGTFPEGMAMDVEYRLAADGAGTVLDFDSRATLKGLLFVLMAPLIRLAAGANAKRDLAALKRLAEATA